MATLDHLLTTVATGAWALPLVALVCLVDGFFPPVPSETLLVAAAAATWVADPSRIVLVVGCAAAGAWAGDNIAYLIGRRVGVAPFPWLRRPGYLAAVRRARLELDRRPESILLTGRFVPFGRVLLNMTAGATGLPHRRFLLLSMVSAAAWACVVTAIVVVTGSVIGAQPMWTAVWATGAAVLLGLVVDRVVAARRGAPV